jgi:virginiamycin B lyase
LTEILRSRKRGDQRRSLPECQEFGPQPVRLVFLGRLDLTTGDVKEWPSPGGPKSQPYGIVSLKGAIWYSESATKPNTLVRFDPKTEKFQTWAIPGGGVRNMMVTRDGNIAMACSGVNKVALAAILFT